jgi:flagellar L-ring protein precursor FlgH
MRFLLLFIFSLLAGCSVAPSSIVAQPTTMRAPLPVPIAGDNGAIFQVDSFRPMFGDFRAHAVGDVLTIVITENVSADKKNAASGNNSGKMNASVNKLFGITTNNLSMSETAQMQSAATAVGSASSNFTGTIAVTVLEVMPNGNLRVSGEKQIGLDKGTEFIRLSGMVMPSSIAVGNMVPSTKLADSRLEYRTNSQFDAAEILKWLSRLFSTVLLL